MITPTLSRSPAKTFVQFISGPVKIKDGLYMGDEIAAKDIDFIVSNKVTHIINTVVKKVPNLYQKYGIQYLSVNWTEKQQNIFDKKNNALNSIQTFIDQAMEQGESVLVHSLHGKSRSGCVIIAYLMKKYNWSLQKSYDFVVSKKDSFKLRSLFLNQLQQLEKRLIETMKLTKNWNQHLGQQDKLLANTFKNQKADPTLKSYPLKKGNKKISWGQKIIISPENRTGLNILTSTSKYKQYLGESGIKNLKPILKNCKQYEQFNKIQDIEILQAQQISKQVTKDTEKTKQLTTQQEKLTKSQALGGSKVYTVVNNYTLNQKPKSQRYSSIPVRDQKKQTTKSGSKLATYQNVISSLRSPYDVNFLNRIGDSSKKKTRQEYKQYTKNSNFQSQQRPSSAKGDHYNTAKSYDKLTTNSREEAIYNNSKNRQAWTTQRQNIIRYK